MIFSVVKMAEGLKVEKIEYHSTGNLFYLVAFTQILLALLNILIDNHCTNTYNAVKIEYQTQNKTKVAS